MTSFEINLLRDRATPAPVRKVLFWGVAGYLLICILLLAWTVNRSTLRLVRAGRLRHTIDAKEQVFQSTHHRSEDVLTFAQRAQNRVKQDAQSLESIEALIRDRVSLVNVVSGLTAPLPGGVDLLSLNLDARKKALTFAVVVPEGRMGATVSSGRLASIWNADETLQARLGRIRAVSTRRDRVDTRPVIVMQFMSELR